MSNCCEESLKKIEALEQENAKLERRIEDLGDEVAAAEDTVEKAERYKDKIYRDRRDEKRQELAMLRRLEFILHGLCPVCLGVVEHKTGCDLKLAIFSIDHELNRSEYVHL